MTGALKLGTRGSTLALWQAEWIKAALAGAGVATELVIIKTRGDAEVDRPLHELEGKGFFTKEIEQALHDGRIDVAVHSLKDLPTSLPAGLVLAAVPKRADPAEVLVTREANMTSLAGLAAGAKVGTSSLRRVAQIRYLRADLDIVPLRGNVPTRVRKVKEGRDGLEEQLLRLALADPGAGQAHRQVQGRRRPRRRAGLQEEEVTPHRARLLTAARRNGARFDAAP